LHTHGPPAEPSRASPPPCRTPPDLRPPRASQHRTERLVVHCHSHPVAGRPQHRTAPATIFFLFSGRCSTPVSPRRCEEPRGAPRLHQPRLTFRRQDEAPLPELEAARRWPHWPRT
jgi:hypothetical protein